MDTDKLLDAALIGARVTVAIRNAKYKRGQKGLSDYERAEIALADAYERFSTLDELKDIAEEQKKLDTRKQKLLPEKRVRHGKQQPMTGDATLPETGQNNQDRGKK